ncbi:MAG: hypothetical protein O7A68_02915 [Alphaproteobacteria bacterium]|nr:hypothetical protein [Alphaproteobacteria bacterium]
MSNAGGLINLAQELEPGGWDRNAARRQPTNEAADRVARERLDSRRSV